MSFSVLSTATNSIPVTTSGNDPVTLLSTVTLTTGADVLQFLGYAAGAYSDSGTMLQVVIDDVVVASQNAFGPLVATAEVSAGEHNIDFQAISGSFDVTLATRGLTILSLS